MPRQLIDFIIKNKNRIAREAQKTIRKDPEVRKMVKAKILQDRYEVILQNFADWGG